MIRSHKYRIYPTASQSEKLGEMLLCFCRLYNAALESRIDAYRKAGVTISYNEQAAGLKEIRECDEQYRQFSHTAKQKVLKRLDKAYRAFFARIKRGQKAGFPRFKASARFNTAEFTYGDGLRLQGNRLRIVGIPAGIRVRWHRELPDGAKIKAATVSRRDGKWFVSLQFECNDVLPVVPDSVVGIDLGLSSFIATSEGETLALPQFTKDHARQLRRANRRLARRKKGSSGWKAAKASVRKVHRRVAGEREKFIQSTSKRLVAQYDGIVLEDLNVKGLARGMLAKSVHNAAWSKFVHCLSYKAENAGKTVEFVNPAYTSQACSGCGSIYHKTLTERVHNCPDCGLVLDRDVNAAVNILHKSNLWAETVQDAPTYRDAECVASKAVCFS